jgi:FMN phosphatase YigB (HAD superfamily)
MRRHRAPAPTTDAPRLSRLVTFDCFDTVITRAVGSPDAIGYVTGLRLQREGVLTVAPDVFSAARVEAEHLTRERHRDDYVLADVAAQQAALLGLGPEFARVLLEAELDTERHLSRPVAGMAERLQAERHSGASVAFLSDTPLQGVHLGELLRKHLLLQDGDVLWVSNELRAGKRSGTAYAEVVRRLGAAPSSWTHLGDDELADLRNARWAGITPVHLPAARLNRYELELERHRTASGGLASVLAGASRQTRLTLAHGRPDVPAAQVDVAAGVAGPLLVGYLLWCLARAADAGLRRLYFVARDGEVLLEMAQHLIKGLDLDLDLRYLHGSRKAWLLTGDPDHDRESLLAVAGREDVVTVRSTLDWLDLTPQQVARPLLRAGFPADAWDRRLGGDELGRVADLVHDPDVSLLLAEAATEGMRASQAYFAEAGLLDREPFGLVDMVGRGTTGRFLARMLRSMGGAPPAQEYYFGLTSQVHEEPDRDVRAYMYDDAHGTGVAAREMDLWVPLEVFTQARHGHVLGYAVVDGRPQPVLQHAVDDALVAWGIDGYRHALDVFTAEVALTLRWVDPRGDVRRATWEVLRTFWLTPTDAEVAAWADFPRDDDGRQHPIGRSYTGSEVLASVLQRRPALRPQGTWPAAVRRTSGAPVRAVSAAAALGRRGIRKARRLDQVVRARREVTRRS